MDAHDDERVTKPAKRFGRADAERGRAMKGTVSTVSTVSTVRQRRRRSAALLSLLVLSAAALAACIPQPPPGRGPNPALTVTDVIGGLDHPWDLAFTPDNWLVFTERSGTVIAKQMPSGPAVTVGTPAQLPGGFRATGEGGLLGLAIDPEFASNRFVYACYTTNVDVRLVRFTLHTFTDGALTHNHDVVTGMPVNPSGRHSGCRPRFRPGTSPPQLFVGTGDSASDGSIPQSPTSLGGKVLCVDRDGGACPGNPGRRVRPADLLVGAPQRAGHRVPSLGRRLQHRARSRPRRRGQRAPQGRLRLEPGARVQRVRADDAPRRDGRGVELRRAHVRARRVEPSSSDRNGGVGTARSPWQC